MTEASTIKTHSRSRTRRWLLSYPRAVPFAIFVAILAVTALSVFSIESNVRAREAAQMRGYAQSIASSMERRGNGFSSYLRAGAALFSSLDEVRPEHFRQFVSELRLDVDYKGVEGIGWIAVEPGADATATGAEPDAVRGTPASYYAPVRFFSPETTRNRRAIGFDMYSDPVRAAAMDEARRTVRPTASGGVLLAQDSSGSPSDFEIFMPVYSGAPATRNFDESLKGFVYAPFEAAQFLDAAIEQVAAQNLGVRLYDGALDSDRILVNRSVTGDATESVQQDVTIANRQLILLVESDKSRLLAPLSMVTLFFGLAIASLLMLLARLLTQQAKEVQTRLDFFEEQHSIRNSLTRELNHRVKNTLANILSILSLTRRRADNLEDFADSLEGRIRSLSATHDLLTKSDWSSIPIRSVIEAELQHFRTSSEGMVSIEGPPVELAPNDALSFGLAIHELATNAAKYGSLSLPTGTVEIDWQVVGDGLARVNWCEQGGPTVPSERKRGFGTDLIEKIIAHELKQPVILDFAPDGVRCTMQIYVRRRGEFQLRDKDNLADA